MINHLKKGDVVSLDYNGKSRLIQVEGIVNGDILGKKVEIGDYRRFKPAKVKNLELVATGR